MISLPAIFSQLISGPFHDGLVVVFIAVAAMSFIGAIVSLMRGKRFVYREQDARTGAADVQADIAGSMVRRS